MLQLTTVDQTWACQSIQLDIIEIGYEDKRTTDRATPARRRKWGGNTQPDALTDRKVIDYHRVPMPQTAPISSPGVRAPSPWRTYIGLRCCAYQGAAPSARRVSASSRGPHPSGTLPAAAIAIRPQCAKPRIP